MGASMHHGGLPALALESGRLTFVLPYAVPLLTAFLPRCAVKGNYAPFYEVNLVFQTFSEEQKEQVRLCAT